MTSLQHSLSPYLRTCLESSGLFRYWIRPLILTDSSNDAVLLSLISTQKLLDNLLAGKNMSVYINPGYIYFLFQAMLHASVVCQRRLVVDWVPASDLDVETANEVSTSSVIF